MRSDDSALTLRQTLQTQHYALKPENEPLKPCARRPVSRPRDKKRVPKEKFVSREMPTPACSPIVLLGYMNSTFCPRLTYPERHAMEGCKDRRGKHDERRAMSEEK